MIYYAVYIPMYAYIAFVYTYKYCYIIMTLIIHGCSFLYISSFVITDMIDDRVK